MPLAAAGPPARAPTPKMDEIRMLQDASARERLELGQARAELAAERRRRERLEAQMAAAREKARLRLAGTRRGRHQPTGGAG